MSASVTRSEENTASPFMFGQVPITIERPAYAASRGHVVARVGIGPNWHTAEGKTPERAAKWLRVRLAGLFAYGDVSQKAGRNSDHHHDSGGNPNHREGAHGV